MQQNIKRFLCKNYDQEALDSLELLDQSGSSRKYYRFKFKGKSLILTEGETVEENKSFLYFTRHFSQTLDNLPRIDAISEDFTLYTQSDLGNHSLMNYLKTNREKSKELFRKSIHMLVKMQVYGDENLDYSQCFSYPKFNYLMVLRDFFSFKNYFLNLIGIEFNAGSLLKDFENLAFDFEKIPYQYFVYRDFQSRNIMIYNDEPYFIDYQGGLKGPPQYDLVSLLWQAKANLSKEWKSEFYDLYVEEFLTATGQDLDTLEFKKAYDFCLIERLIQVLGTYGFRGIYERKPHFLESIEFALRNLGEIQDLNLLTNYPELQRIIHQLSLPQTINKIKQLLDGK